MPRLPRLKHRSVRSVLALTVLVLVASLAHKSSSAQSNTPSDVFNEDAAARLLRQVADGLQGHSERRMLSAFDLSRMDDGPLFKEQITSFFNQYDPIRVHFKLVEVKDNVAFIDAEMDDTPRDSTALPQHKSVTLRLTAGKTPAGWKIINLQPRDFFS